MPSAAKKKSAPPSTIAAKGKGAKPAGKPPLRTIAGGY